VDTINAVWTGRFKIIMVEILKSLVSMFVVILFMFLLCARPFNSVIVNDAVILANNNRTGIAELRHEFNSYRTRIHTQTNRQVNRQNIQPNNQAVDECTQRQAIYESATNAEMEKIKMTLARMLIQQHAPNTELVGEFTSECVICLEAPRHVLLQPCRHLATCDRCVDAIQNTCPVCRTAVTSHINGIY